MDKFKNKYRIPSARLQTWDYGSNAAYFITICTKNREHFFGRVSDGIMILSEIGILTEKYWNEIPNHFPFVQLGVFVSMPNHIHGIIIINKTKNVLDADMDGANGVETQYFASPCNADGVTVNANGVTNDADGVGTQNFASLRKQPQQYKINKFGPQSQNLASIIRGYKIGVTINARLINPWFNWQPRYHDHIIRNAAEYERIQNYIANNPKKWNDDKFN